METYRVRGSTKANKKAPASLSFGPSSASLLHILDHHLQGQYDRMTEWLWIICVMSSLRGAADERLPELLEKYKARYPRHEFSSFGLEESLNLQAIDWANLGYPQPRLRILKKSEQNDFKIWIRSIPSATSRADIVSTLLTRLLVTLPKEDWLRKYTIWSLHYSSRREKHSPRTAKVVVSRCPGKSLMGCLRTDWIKLSARDC